MPTSVSVAPILLPRDASRGMPAEISLYYFGERDARGRKRLDGRFVTRKMTGRRWRETESALGNPRVASHDLISRCIVSNKGIFGKALQKLI